MSPHFHTRFPKPSVIDRVSPRKPKAEAVREVGGLRRTRGKRAACDMTVDDARWTARDGGGRMITHTHTWTRVRDAWSGRLSGSSKAV